MTTLAVGIVAVVGVLGLLIGSFINVVIHRVPAGKSIVSPPSACPRCGIRIKSWDNIPVLSWILLGAKCRHCAEPISRRYPLVELSTGLLFVAAAVRFLPQFDGTADQPIAGILVLVVFLYFAAISVALAGIDLDTHSLPNVIVLPSYLVVALFLGAAAIVVGDYDGLLGAAIGGTALFACYFILALVYPGGMGFGDVKLAGVIGMLLGYLGWGELVVGAFAAFLLGGVFGLALLLSKKANRKSGIPFGPWMLAGAWLGIFIGERSWNWYLGLFHLA